MTCAIRLSPQIDSLFTHANRLGSKLDYKTFLFCLIHPNGNCNDSIIIINFHIVVIVCGLSIN
jgi:hypothetical protein